MGQQNAASSCVLQIAIVNPWSAMPETALSLAPRENVTWTAFSEIKTVPRRQLKETQLCDVMGMCASNNATVGTAPWSAPEMYKNASNIVPGRAAT